MLSNHKSAERKGKVQLINAATNQEKPKTKGGDVALTEHVFYQAMRKSLGSKRKELTEEGIEIIVKTYGQFIENDFSKIFDYHAFGYRRITVERPLKLAIYPKDAGKLAALQADSTWEKIDKTLQTEVLTALSSFSESKILSRDGFEKQFIKALKGSKLSAVQLKLVIKHLGEQDDEAVVCKTKGQIEANPDLRDNENVPLTESIDDYFAREVLPHVPDAWIDISKIDEKDRKVGIVGYEIPFNRHFYVYQPPRALEEIDADLDAVSAEIMALLQEVHS